MNAIYLDTSRHRMGRMIRLLLWASLALGLLARPAFAQERPTVYVMTFDGPVNPILVSYVERGIAEAEQKGAAAVVLRLDTPGGQVDLTQDIVKSIRAATVPVIVYVWPTGAMAGSAGTFITLAGHAAAMTPGSSIGAASPVAGGGEELSETMTKKVTNILAADIENLAQRRGPQAVEWARKAVEEAAAATADQALELGVIDAVATDVDDLLRKLDGFMVEVGGQRQTLALQDAQTVDLPLTGLERFLNTIINAITIPGIAVLLIVLGVQAIISELSSPGGYLAGITGGVALLLGLYALGILNANWAGLGFIALSFVLFLLDIKAPTHGALTFGGILTFIFGAAMLFQGTEVAVPWGTIIGLALFSALFFGFVIAKVLQTRGRRPTWGQEALIGTRAVARTELNPAGKVVAQGEWWDAELEGEAGPVLAGAELTVVGRQGFKLLVKRAA